MKIRRTGFTAAVAAATVVASASAAHAAPDPSAPAAVTYQATLSDRSVLVTLDNGTFAPTPDDTTVTIRDARGETVDALPLSYAIDGQQLPIHRQISDDGRILRLTPEVDRIDRPALRLVASPLEDQLAMNDLINAVSIGTSVGSLIGTAIGAVLGIGVGVALTGASCVLLSLGCVVAVLPIVSLVGAAGGLAGLVLGGGPTAAVALYQYVTTLQAAPGQSKYAQNLQGKPGVPPAAPDAAN
ncbi:hypothetical protein ACLMAL_34825 [Nocardia sp. CWNU-33]|uniref:hypothetical protein n=1 Tax=Nocardia sp. CWNU-33 TaxID=3392117 RepID=UPI00398F6946